MTFFSVLSPEPLTAFRQRLISLHEKVWEPFKNGCSGGLGPFVPLVPKQNNAAPKEAIEKISVTVLDRFGNPMPDTNVHLKREFTGSFSMQPYEDVARGDTDKNGIVTFENVRVDDWGDADSPDDRFSGRITLESGKSNYTLRLTNMTYTSISFGMMPVSDIEKYEDRASLVFDSLRKIVDHYVANEAEEFFSLKYYVDEGAITRNEADRILFFAPQMTDAKDALNFCWARKELRVPAYDKPIQWVAESD